MTIVGFALIEGNGSIKFADIVLMLAVIAAAFGYAEGGKLAKILGGWQVICWALVFSVPILIIPVASVVLQTGISASLSAWLGFGYVSIISMLLSFFAWYRGLAIGGIARVSQVQLLQPFLSILLSALFLREKITFLMVCTAVIVVASIAIGRRQPVEYLK